MPNICCRCNARGRCKNCSCKKSGRDCSGCLPHHHGLCTNQRSSRVSPPSLPLDSIASPPNDTLSATNSESFSNLSPAAATDAAATVTPATSSYPPSEADVTIDHAAQIHNDTTPPMDCSPLQLPSFPPIHSNSFCWGERDGDSVAHSIQHCYDEVVHWKRNIFKIPSGKAGKAFVRETTRLFQAYATGSALESIALQAAMIMPALLLQKPHAKSKAADHSKHLDRRLQLWSEGNFKSLLDEGRTIQHQFALGTRSANKTDQNIAKKFANHMMEGRVKAALRLISQDNYRGTLSLDSIVDSDNNQTVRDILFQKHPSRQPITKSAIISSHATPSQQHPHPILFDKIDGHLIHSTILRMDGAAGPSGLDCGAWKRLCSSFKSASSDLCEALASLAKRISTTLVDPKGLTAFVACRLIALDKCPGVRPVGVGEVVRRIICRAIANTLSEFIQEAAGPLQVCAGHISGCEAAIHVVDQMFSSDESQAVLLVDATNAFNSLNRQVALQNITKICPSLSTTLINTYRDDICLFIDGETLLSQEGTTQGDPLAMAMYAIAITPLIDHLQDQNTKQVWFADDATAVGDLSSLKSWWNHLDKIGPEYGYLPNATKSWLIVKQDQLEQAKSLFKDTGVSITTEGQRHLGAALGSSSFVESYVQNKISGWIREVNQLSVIAQSQPHTAYAAFNHGLTSKWSFISRTIPNIEDLFKPLETSIRHKFLPALTGQNQFDDTTRDLIATPVRLGGLGIIDPSRQSTNLFTTSLNITSPLTSLILQQSPTYPPEVRQSQIKAKTRARNLRHHRQSLQANELKSTLPCDLNRVVNASSEKGASSWLSTLPIDEHGFALHKGAFRDALCLRYGWRPPHLPSLCVCGAKFTVEHSLNCPRGGFPSIRHNEIRDVTADLLSEVCHNVGIEPSLQPVTGEILSYRSANREDGARLDVVAESFWGRNRQRAFFDVRVFNPFAQSLRNTPLPQCYRQNELQKKRAYDQRVREIEHGSFSALVFSTTGGMGTTATTVYKRLASMIANKHNKTYSKTIHWLRCRLSFSLLRSAIMCLRGSRSSLHHPEINLNNIDLAITEGRVSHI